MLLQLLMEINLSNVGEKNHSLFLIFQFLHNVLYNSVRKKSRFFLSKIIGTDDLVKWKKKWPWESGSTNRKKYLPECNM